MRKKKIFITLATLAIMLFMGCTNSEAQQGKITLTFDQFSGNANNEKYLREMIKLYNEENPDVIIKLQSYGFNDYFTQLSAKISANRAPDVFELNYENFVAYAGNNTLKPFNNLQTDLSNYNSDILSVYNLKGEQLGVPNSFSTMMLFYNKDLFDKAGISYPTNNWTWDDAMVAAQKIRALDSNIFGYYIRPEFTDFYLQVLQNGGNLFSADGKQFTVNTPRNIETLQHLIDMQQKMNIMPTQAQLAGLDDWTLFKAGRLGMTITGIWAFPEFTREAKFNWDVAVAPGQKQKATVFYTNGYVISKTSQHAEEAAKFITFISSNPKATAIRVAIGWEIPPVNDEAIIAEYLKLTPPSNREAVFESLNYKVILPVIPQFAEMDSIFRRNLLDAGNGSITAQQALDQIQTECEQHINLAV